MANPFAGANSVPSDTPPAFLEDGDGPQPKRKAGRPRGSTTTRGKSTNVAKEVNGLVQFANLIVLQTNYRADALSPEEVGELADALTEEINANPAVLRWMNRASKIVPHVKLINVLFSITVVRLARHGKLPSEYGRANAPVPVASGRTHGGDWGHGDGQVNVDGTPIPQPFVRSDGSDQAG